MKILIWISLLALTLSLELNSLYQLNIYGEIKILGNSYLYLPLVGYDKDIVDLSVSFDEGKVYSQLFIMYKQSNDLNLTSSGYTKKTVRYTYSKKTSYTFEFRIILNNSTNYLIIYVPQ